MRLTEPAPAKVNLFLHVGPVETDGYHPLASLVAFADVGDRVSVEPADRLTLRIEGPYGDAIDGPGDDNLILRAVRAFAAAAGLAEPGLAFTLDKRLPVAAGLGGGSSDAGAALRLARRLLAPSMSDAALEAVAATVGADGPMCLRARSAWAEGRGERLEDAPDLPVLHAVLINPGRPSPTGAVYRAYDAAPVGDAERPAPPPDWSEAAVIGWLAKQRNDLQAPAVGLEPAIGEALRQARSLPGCRLARMSGSGATVFGLFDDEQAATSAAAWLSKARPTWWVVADRLGGRETVKLG